MSRRRLVVWGVVVALLAVAATVWFVRQETLLAQWRNNHERLVLVTMQRVVDELNRQVILPQAQRSNDQLDAVANVDLSGDLVDLGSGQIVWKSELVGSDLSGATVTADVIVSTDATPVNSLLGSTDRLDELVVAYSYTESGGAVTSEVRVCSLRHGTSADAPVPTSRVQISPNQYADPCPASVVARWTH